MPRKPGPIPVFTHHVQFYVTAAMAESLELLAAHNETTQSAIIRAALLEYLRAHVPAMTKPAVNGHHHQEQPDVQP